MLQNLKKTTDLITFTEEILTGKLHFLKSGCPYKILYAYSVFMIL